MNDHQLTLNGYIKRDIEAARLTVTVKYLYFDCSALAQSYVKCDYISL